MDDTEIRVLAEQVGLTAPIADVVAWARQRTEDVLAGGVDNDLAALLEGRPVTLAAVATAAPGRPALTETQPRAHVPRQLGSEVALRLPLPPVPQRPDLPAPRAQDSADDLEMLDEEDLELMEDVGESDPDAAAAAMSSPEWKRALADAQGE